MRGDGAGAGEGGLVRSQILGQGGGSHSGGAPGARYTRSEAAALKTLINEVANRSFEASWGYLTL